MRTKCPYNADLLLERKVIMKKKSYGKVNACIVILKIDVAQIPYFVQTVQKSMAMNKEAFGCSGYITVFSKVDAQSLRVIGSIGFVIVKEQLQGLIIQYNRLAVVVEAVNHF